MLEVYIPSGNYGLGTFVALTGGTAVSIRLDGIIYRIGQASPWLSGRIVLIVTRTTASGNMILIENTTDFELYSSTSKGAIQGYGYVFHSRKFHT